MEKDELLDPQLEADIEIDLMGDEEDVVVEITPDYELEYPELKNLARDMDEEEITRISTRCMEDFRADDESRAEWLEKMAHNLKLYLNKAKPKHKPWQGASEDTIPVLLEAVNQWSTRSVSTLFTSDEIVRHIPIGNVTENDIKRAKRTTKHTNWSLLTKNKRWKPNKKALLRALGIHGSYFTKTFWDPIKSHPETINIRPTDLIVSYGDGPRHIDDIDRITHKYSMPLFKAKRCYKEGYFSVMPEGEFASSITQNTYDEVVKDASGFTQPVKEISDQVEILEQHTYWDLGEDQDVPVIVWLCARSEKVLRIAFRCDVDNEQSIEVPEMQDEMAIIGQQENPHFGKPVDFTPTKYFVHYKYVDNPDGFYGHGLADFVGPMDVSINKMLRQCIDAATLSNTNGGFISKQAAFRKGSIDWTMGKFQSVDAPVDDIRKHIMRFDFKGADPTMLQLMQTMLQRADRLAMTTDALTGQVDKVFQPSTIIALIEQGLQPFTAAMTNVVEALGEELEIMYKLYGKYLNTEEYFAVLDMHDPENMMQMMQESAGPDDYALDAQIKPIADLRMATEHAKVARAELELNFATTNPFTQQSPQHLHNAFKRFAQNMDIHNISEILPSIEELMAGQGEQNVQPGQPNDAGGDPAMVQPEGNPMGDGATEPNIQQAGPAPFSTVQ